MVNVCVFGFADPLPKYQTNRGPEDFSSCYVMFWRPLNSKRSLPVLKWTSESEYFERYKKFQIFFCRKYQSKSNHITPRCACTARGNYQPTWQQQMSTKAIASCGVMESQCRTPTSSRWSTKGIASCGSQCRTPTKLEQGGILIIDNHHLHPLNEFF